MFFNCNNPGISTHLLIKDKYLEQKEKLAEFGWVWDGSTQELMIKENTMSFVILVRVIPFQNFVDGTRTPVKSLSSYKAFDKED